MSLNGEFFQIIEYGNMIKKDQSNYKYYTKKAEEIENTKKDTL